MAFDYLAEEQVLLIGLDGATFDLIEPLAAQGRLPHLARLMEGGAWGRLRSTRPAHSAPAWTSCVTGVNPGKHGISSFFRWDPQGYRFLPVNASDIRYPCLWQLVNAKGRPAGILNLPVGYPPPEVDGYAVSGMLAPDLDTACYPAAIKDELLAAAPGYQIEAPISPDRKATLDALLHHIAVRETAAHYLRRRHPTAFTMVVFTGLDRLQHFYWADMDPQHPSHEQVAGQGLEDAIASGYQRLDQAVGQLLERTGEDTTVLIVSDHGFQPIYRRFMVNLWLEQQGLLVLHRQRRALIEWVRSLVLRLGLRRVASRVKRMVPGAENIRMGSMSYAAVDWPRTAVVFGADMGLTFNLEGREARGVVAAEEFEAVRDRLITNLQQVRDPETGEYIVEQVQLREEIYHGDVVALAPDLRLEMADHREGDWTGHYIHQRALEPGPVLRPPGRVHAGHSPEGIFLAYGPGLRAGVQLQGAQILDVTPTTLYAMGLSVPRYMDGRVLTEIFAPEHLSAHPPQYSEEDVPADRQDFSYDESETALVEDRLRGLGYMG